MPGLPPDHRRSEGSGAVENAAQVRVQDGIPIRRRQFMEGAAEAADARVVDENVYLVELLQNGCGEGFHRCEVSYVANHRLAAAVLCRDLLCRSLKLF